MDLFSKKKGKKKKSKEELEAEELSLRENLRLMSLANNEDSFMEYVNSLPSNKRKHSGAVDETELTEKSPTKSKDDPGPEAMGGTGARPKIRSSKKKKTTPIRIPRPENPLTTVYATSQGTRAPSKVCRSMPHSTGASSYRTPREEPEEQNKELIALMTRGRMRMDEIRQHVAELNEAAGNEEGMRAAEERQRKEFIRHQRRLRMAERCWLARWWWSFVRKLVACFAGSEVDRD